MFDRDPQRVCILQGPVAVKYCTTTHQPIGELLGGIENSLIKKLLHEFYSDDESLIPTIDYLAPAPRSVDEAAVVRDAHIAHSVEKTSSGGSKHTYNINGVLPPTGEWLDVLAGPKLSWLQAFLSNVSITAGKTTLDNPAKRVLAPRHNQRVELSLFADGSPVRLSFLESPRGSELTFSSSACRRSSKYTVDLHRSRKQSGLIDSWYIRFSISPVYSISQSKCIGTLFSLRCTSLRPASRGSEQESRAEGVMRFALSFATDERVLLSIHSITLYDAIVKQ